MLVLWLLVTTQTNPRPLSQNSFTKIEGGAKIVASAINTPNRCLVVENYWAEKRKVSQFDFGFNLLKTFHVENCEIIFVNLSVYSPTSMQRFLTSIWRPKRPKDVESTCKQSLALTDACSHYLWLMSPLLQKGDSVKLFFYFHFGIAKVHSMLSALLLSRVRVLVF